MALQNLATELHVLIATELDKPASKNLRLVCRSLNRSTRSTYAQRFAEIRKYTITAGSWAANEHGEDSDTDFFSAMADPDYGPVARVLKVVLPADLVLLHELLSMKEVLGMEDILPGLLRVARTFEHLGELIIEPASDVTDGAFGLQWIPGTIFRTLAALEAPLSRLTILSPEQEGARIAVTGLYIDNGIGQRAIPTATQRLLDGIKKFQYQLGTREEVTQRVSLWSAPTWHNYDRTGRWGYLQHALTQLENFELVQVSGLSDCSHTDHRSALAAFTGGNDQFSKLKRIHIAGAFLNPNHLWDFIRRDRYLIESIELRNVVLMQVEHGAYRTGWWGVMLPINMGATSEHGKLKNIVLENCQDAVQYFRPTPAFSVEWAKESKLVLVGRNNEVAQKLGHLLVTGSTKWHQKMMYRLEPGTEVDRENWASAPSAKEDDIHAKLYKRMIRVESKAAAVNVKVMYPGEGVVRLWEPW